MGKAATKIWHDSNRKRLRELQRKSVYGLEPEQYDALVKKHAGRCAVCKNLAKLGIDHDHATGRVRGLLCHHCNLAAGHLKDNAAIAARLARYLRPAC